VRGEKSSLSVILFGMFLTISAHAADKTKSTTIDCSKDSLEAELNKLDRSIPNAVEVTGECTGLVTIEGHRDLTLVGIAPASISGVYVPEDSAGSTTALDIFDSRVTLQDITINGGNYGLFCSDKSTCILRDVTVQGGHVGVGVQSQSAVDILGSSQIINSENWGVGVFGASSVNMRPNWDSGFDPFEAGPLVSGHEVGIWVQDGSFFRSDNVTVTGNVNGVQAQRDAVIKMFVAYDFDNDQYAVPGAGVTGNAGYGFQIHRNSTAQIGLPVTNNGGSGIRLGSLSFLQNAGLFFDQNGGDDVSCEDPTAVSNFCEYVYSVVADCFDDTGALQAAVDAAPVTGATIYVSGVCDAVDITGKSNILIDGGDVTSANGVSGELLVSASHNVEISGFTAASALITNGSSVSVNDFNVDGPVAVRVNGSLTQTGGALNFLGVMDVSEGAQVRMFNGTFFQVSLTRNAVAVLNTNEVDGSIIDVTNGVGVFSGSSFLGQSDSPSSALSISGPDIFVQRTASMILSGSTVVVDVPVFVVRQNAALDILRVAEENFRVGDILLQQGGGARAVITPPADPSALPLIANCDGSAWTANNIACAP